MTDKAPDWPAGLPVFEYVTEGERLSLAEQEMRGYRRLAALKARRAGVRSPRAQALLDEAIQKQALVTKARRALRRWQKKMQGDPA